MAKSVILIDHDPEDLDILKEVISSIDPAIVCISFIYPDEAVRVLLSREPVVVPDLIFIDINMPGVTGDKCLKALRKDIMFDNVLIAMYSTSMPEAVSDALKLLGANYTFEKPVRMARYTEIIEDVLSKLTR